MHELSIAVNIVEIAEENARKENASSISEIELEVGTQSGVVLEALELAMESAKKDSMMENAKIVIRTISAKANCSKCGKEFYSDEIYTPCPKCGNPFCDIIQGKELKVKSLKIE
jgi:hydrogenase nickel incorporation protein HypA/HybF